MLKLAIALLDDDDGINEDAYGILMNLLSAENQDDADAVSLAVRVCGGKFYLPHDHGIGV